MIWIFFLWSLFSFCLIWLLLKFVIGWEEFDLVIVFKLSFKFDCLFWWKFWCLLFVVFELLLIIVWVEVFRFRCCNFDLRGILMLCDGIFVFMVIGEVGGVIYFLSLFRIFFIVFVLLDDVNLLFCLVVVFLIFCFLIGVWELFLIL